MSLVWSTCPKECKIEIIFVEKKKQYSRLFYFSHDFFFVFLYSIHCDKKNEIQANIINNFYING